MWSRNSKVERHNPLLVRSGPRAVFMRPSVAIIFLLAACNGCVTHADATESIRSAAVQPATPQPESFRACVWIWDRDGSTQFRYTVDLDKEKVGDRKSTRLNSSHQKISY